MLFQPSVINEGAEYLQWIECRPINQISEDSSIDLRVKASGSQYLDLQRSVLCVKAKIVKEDGTNLDPAADKVIPINLFMQSLFSQVDVYFQQKLVSSSGTNYPYKAMMDVLLNFGQDATSTQLQTQLYYADTAGSMDHTDPTTTPINAGLIKRNNIAKVSALMDMVGPVYADVFQLSRFLLKEVEVRLKLFQSKNAFRLMTGEKATKYKVIITDVLLKAAMVGVSAGLLETHAQALRSQPAIYPLTKTDVKTFAVAKGQYNVNLNDIFQGRIPDRVVLGMTSSSAYAGHLEKNAFNFEHFNFEFMCLYSNGQSVPAKALQPKFSSSNYMDAYQTLFSGTGIAGKDAGLGISREAYAKGYTLVVFDLSSEIVDAGVQAVQKQGNLQLEIRFASALTESINVILYASFPGEIRIDQARSVKIQ